MEVEAWYGGGGITTGSNVHSVGWTDSATLGHVYGAAGTYRCRTPTQAPSMPDFNFHPSFVRRSNALPANEFVAPGLKPGASRRYSPQNPAEAHEIRMHRQLACDRYLESCRSHSVPALRPWAPTANRLTPVQTPAQSGGRRSPFGSSMRDSGSPAGSHIGSQTPLQWRSEVGGGAPSSTTWPPERLRRVDYSNEEPRARSSGGSGSSSRRALGSGGSSPLDELTTAWNGRRAPGSSGSLGRHELGSLSSSPSGKRIQQLPPLSEQVALSDQAERYLRHGALDVRLNAWASPPRKYFVCAP